ncbi:MAG: YerC/YecD family TrpR-related protein [Clostridia bacterium]|nr:YerC/YecD family TrpR-related protein [Clostridia bacterium]
MEHTDFSELLFEAMATLETKDEIKNLFNDICTPKEVKSIAQRFGVAKMLNEGAVYSEIVKATGASTATVSRVNRTMDTGCKTALERMGKK